jgi:hypothetical protein
MSNACFQNFPLSSPSRESKQLDNELGRKTLKLYIECFKPSKLFILLLKFIVIFKIWWRDGYCFFLEINWAFMVSL